MSAPAHARNPVSGGRKEKAKTRTMENSLDVSEKRKTALQVTHPENPWLEAASETRNELGRLLKFMKGKWMVGDDLVPDGTEYIAHLPQAMRGFVHFQDGKVVDRKIGKIADGFKPPQRVELSDNDPENWSDRDANGKPRDPWVAQWFLPLISVEIGDLVTFVTGSKGGISAIANLCRIYGSKHRNGLLPIVALRTRSYKHRSTDASKRQTCRSSAGTDRRLHQCRRPPTSRVMKFRSDR